MIKIAICDDEAVMCGQLKKLVSMEMRRQQRQARIVCYTSAVKLLLGELDYDLIFLDIRMPDLDGIELAKRLREKEFSGALIFVTVLKECMLDAFEVEAMDYLCKPIDEARLEAAMKRALKRLEQKTQRRLFIRTADRCRSVKLADIYYCEVINRKIYLHTKSGVLAYYGRMQDVEKQTSPCLVRCHRSFLMNPDYLQEYAEGEVYLENGDHVPVSKKYRQAFRRRLLCLMDEEE